MPAASVPPDLAGLRRREVTATRREAFTGKRINSARPDPRSSMPSRGTSIALRGGAMSESASGILSFPKSPPRPTAQFATIRDEVAQLPEDDTMDSSAETSGIQAAGAFRERFDAQIDIDVDVGADAQASEEPDLICRLFDALIHLDREADLLGAANYCIRALLDHMCPRAVFVHEYDAIANNFVVLAAAGPGADALVGARHLMTDPILSVALQARRGAVIDEETGEGTLWSWRLFRVGPVRNVVVAPIVDRDRLIGVIELAVGVDAEPLGAREADGVSYVAERLGELAAAQRA
jgi:hypothetical protein